MSKSSGPGRTNGPLITIIYLLILLFLLFVLAVCIFRRTGAPLPEPAAVEETPSQVLMAPVESEAPVIVPVVKISELMPANKCSVISEDGTFSDWIELYNAGEADTDISDFSLVCSGKKLDTAGITVPVGGYALIFCPGCLPNEGGQVRLNDAEGNTLDDVSYGPCEDDQSVRFADSVPSCSDFPTPGLPNTDEGYESFQSGRSPAGPLAINEVMVYNDSLLKVNYKFYDWVEIKNVSDAPVNLSGYYLSDSKKELQRFQLPDVTLQPGALHIIYCMGDEALTGPDYSNLGLNALRDELYLSDAEGQLSDYTALNNIPLGGSFGRMVDREGFFFFETPSPSAESSKGLRCITETPVSLEADGVFNDVDSVTVSLSASAPIYYEIGGAIPTKLSPVYSGPFTVSETCVIRAVCIEDGKLTGDPLTLSYILNENHTVPVVSLVTTPENWTAVYGAPQRDWEREATVQYFGEDGSFTLDCGFKLHGATSKLAQNKKSIKLCFRSRYAGQLSYDVFGNGVTDFSSILLRSAQEDVYSTYMRDNLMHQLSLKTFPDTLVVQDYKYSALYVNGKYWGLYNLREAHSAEHYANHKGVDVNDITMYREVVVGNCPQIGKIFTFVTQNDISIEANYEKLCTMLDVDSVLAWSIIEAYSGNYDIHPSNVRFYYSESTGQLAYSLADLDLGFFDGYSFQMVYDLGYKYNTIAKKLLVSPIYKEKFLQALSDALNGPLSNENVLADIDSLAAEIRPEIDRDRQRWGGTTDRWEAMVNDMKTFITNGTGRAIHIARGLKGYTNITDADYSKYFGALK